jgi:hypothetical protein
MSGKNLGLLLLTFACLYFGVPRPCHADDIAIPEYLDEIKDRYPEFFVVEIETGRTYFSNTNSECYFGYTATITERIRGKPRAKTFKFFTQDGLMLGEKYLVYFSESRALSSGMIPNPFYTLKSDGSITPVQSEERCPPHNGYFLMYNEIHLIRNGSTNGVLPSYVQFNDPFADWIKSHRHEEQIEEIEYDYVRSELMK